jgi:hypothetical protein
LLVTATVSPSRFLGTTFSMFAQLIFQIAIFLFNGSPDFIIKIWREFFHAVNGPAMLKNLLIEFCFRHCASRKSAFRLKILAVNLFVHVKTSFLTIRIIMTFEDSRVILVITIGDRETSDFRPLASRKGLVVLPAIVF